MSRSTHSRRRAAVALLAAGGTALAGAALLGPATSTASSHREAPLIANDPAADNTDVYAFVSPDKPDTVTLIANWIPLEEPTGGPNFYPFPTDARYNIKIDNDGDAKPDITYRWTFKTQDARGGDTFLYNNGAGELPRRPDPAVQADLRPRRHRRRGQVHPDRHRRQGRALQHRRRRHAELRGPARPGDHRPPPRAARATSARPTTRSSSTCACSTCSTARTSPRPATTPSTATTSTPSRSRCPTRARAQGRRGEEPGHRRLVHHRPPERAYAGRRRHARRTPATSSRSRAWATRWSTRSSSRRNLKDAFNALDAGERRHRRRGRRSASSTPRCRS